MTGKENKQYKLEEIVQFYKEFRSHPRGYLKDTQMPLVEFVHGFETAIRMIFGISNYHKNFEEVCQSRGWQVSAMHPISQMRDANWNEAQITNEILEIEVLTWQKVLFELKNQTENDIE